MGTCSSRLSHNSDHPISRDKSAGSKDQGVHSSFLSRCESLYASNMQSAVTRIASFDHRWKREKLMVQPNELGKAGFYFLSESDKTICFFLWTRMT